MTALRPFFLLLSRAAVFWLGGFALISGLFIVAGVARADTELGGHLDATFIATVWFPAAAGWIIGLVFQEFQHTSFAHHLPGVRTRLAASYLGTGVVVTVIVVGLAARFGQASQGAPLMFVLGLGAYATGGVLQDPLSVRVTVMNTAAAILVVVRSSDLARLTGEHPWASGLIAVGLGAAGLARLFARSTFRRKPFQLSKPVPGRFSLEKSEAYERRRRAEDRSKIVGWHTGYLGSGTWAWVRAAFYETHGGLGWRTVARAVGRLWGLGALLLLFTWLEQGDIGFGEALGRGIYDVLFRSPHQAPVGSKAGPYLMVVIFIAAIGFVTALFRAVALRETVPHPLSRLLRARVAFRAGLVDVAILLAVLGVGLFVVGQATGLLIGYEMRFDFMPFHIRVLMVTLVLMPLGHAGRRWLQAAARRKEGNLVVAVALGATGFVMAVFLGVLVLPQIFGSPIRELTALLTALLVSQWAYRRQLLSYYRTADLA